WCMVVSGRPVYSRYDDVGISVPADKRHEGLRAVAMIPIIHRGRTIGCFNIASHLLDVVPAFSRNALETITAQVGNAIARLQAEEALHESQAELQSIFDSIQDFLFVLDLEGSILRVNQVMIKRLGYDEGELKGMNVLELHPPERHDGAASIIAEIAAGKRDLCPILLQAKNGTRIPVETIVTMGRWGERDVFFGISRDISERLRIEDALRKSEARYHAIVEDQTELICRFMPDGTLNFVNEAYCRYFGRSSEKLIGACFASLIPEEDQRVIFEHLSSVSIDQPVTTYDHRAAVTDGMRWMQWTARGIFDQEGNLVEFQSVGWDITEKKNTEQALRASEEHFRTLTLSSPAGIFRADAQGVCTYVNSRWCEITGQDQSDALGHDWKMYIFSDDLEHVENAMQKLVLDDLPFKIEFRIQRPDNTIAWVLVQIMVTQSSPGEVAGYVGTYTDITYLKQLEMELCKVNQVLEQRIEERTEKLAKASASLIRAYQDLMVELSERRRSEEIRERLVKELESKNAEMEKFVYTVSHDLRSPLITVGGFIDLLKSDLSKGKMDHVDADLSVISSAVSKMDTLLLDTLELSRIGRVANPPEAVPFSEIAQEAADQICEKIRAKGIHLEIEPDQPSVNVDRTRIVEVLVNLIDNSIKYMGDQPHPKIEIGFMQSDGAFFIKDNGAGIDRSQHDKIFELFYKVNRKSEGPGAGLAIVKRIIEVHGGRIWIESELGKGCTACFTLPMSGNP
ncbi:MAG TPA: PAS domain S-box protein, partial [Methanotrichaceae archaeon]|nr:PAS domain S-box protein [Methanotrichaceae archaeon]